MNARAAAALLFACAACSRVELDERYSCASPADCLSGYQCVEGFCLSSSADAGPSPGTAAATWAWTRQFANSEGAAWAKAVGTDRGGNVYVAGSAGRTATGDDVLLLRYSGLGEKQWDRLIGTSLPDHAFDLAVDASTNVVFAGETLGTMDAASAGRWDGFMTARDRDGAGGLARQYGTSNDDRAYGVDVDGAGNVYVAGATYGSLDGNSNNGLQDMSLVKYNAAGTKQWSRQFGTAGFDHARGVGVDGSGNIFLAGSTDRGMDGNAASGLLDMVVVKLNSNGIRQWTRQVGSDAGDGAQGLVVDRTGNVFIFGYTEGGVDGNVNPSPGKKDVVIAKFDTSGNRLWVRQLGTVENENALGGAVDADGAFYAAGYTYGDLHGNQSRGGSDLYVVKLDPSGTRLWTLQRGTPGDDVAEDVAVDASKSIYVAGSTDGAMDGNVLSVTTDLLLVKYTQP